MRKWHVRKAETKDLEYGLVTRSPKWIRGHPDEDYSQRLANVRAQFRNNSVWWMRKGEERCGAKGEGRARGAKDEGGAWSERQSCEYFALSARSEAMVLHGQDFLLLRPSFS